jgi:hypothetical protein
MTRSFVGPIVCLLLGVGSAGAALDAPEMLSGELPAWLAAAVAPRAACPAGASCLELRGVATFRVSARIARDGLRIACRARCAEPIAGTLVLDETAKRYVIPHGAFASCPLDVEVELPDEVGRLRPRGRARLLVPTNRDELEAAMRACSGSVVRVRRLRRLLRSAAADGVIAGTGALVLDIAGTPRIRVDATSRFVATAPGVGSPEAPSVEDTGLQACRGASLRVRCRIE